MVQGDNRIKMDEFKKIRTGVIGVGSMGQNHARIYNEVSKLIGVADLDEKQGKKVANRFGVKFYSDYKNMLKDVDAVTISTPTIYHKEVAKEVIDSGVHLLVEKPFADNSDDAKYILEATKGKDITLAVGHIERHNEVIKKARACIQNNEWGKILTISAKRFSSFPSRIRDVGVLFDLTIHDVDVISYLVGHKINSVFALGGKAKNNTYEDHVILSTQFDNGVIGSCETNWLTPMKVRKINITTDTCFVTIDYMKQDIKINSSSFHNLDSSNLYKSSMEVKQDHIIVDKTEPLKNEINDFLSSIINNREPLVTAEQGLQAVKVVESGLESIKSGDFVNIL